MAKTLAPNRLNQQKFETLESFPRIMQYWFHMKIQLVEFPQFVFLLLNESMEWKKNRFAFVSTSDSMCFSQWWKSYIHSITPRLSRVNWLPFSTLIQCLQKNWNVNVACEIRYHVDTVLRQQSSSDSANKNISVHTRGQDVVNRIQFTLRVHSDMHSTVFKWKFQVSKYQLCTLADVWQVNFFALSRLTSTFAFTSLKVDCCWQSSVFNDMSRGRFPSYLGIHIDSESEHAEVLVEEKMKICERHKRERIMLQKM